MVQTDESARVMPSTGEPNDCRENQAIEKNTGTGLKQAPVFIFQWACRDSNPGPLLCESSALTS
jgi:hypothetical protein